MQNDGAPTQNDAPESHAPKPCTFHLEQIRQNVHFEKKGWNCYIRSFAQMELAAELRGLSATYVVWLLEP